MPRRRARWLASLFVAMTRTELNGEPVRGPEVCLGRRKTPMNRIVAALGALLVASTCHAQPVYQLVGCTASTTASVMSDLVDIDLTTGAATNPRSMGISILAGIAAGPTGNELFALSSHQSQPISQVGSLFRANVETGELSLVGATGLPRIIEGDVSFHPSWPLLFGVQDLGPLNQQRRLFSMNPDTGVAAIIGELPFPGDYSGMAFLPDGTLYLIATPNTGSLLLRVNPLTAAIIETRAMNVTLGVAAGFAIHPITGAAYVADGGANSHRALFELDLSNGQANLVGTLGLVDGVSGLAFVSVPEPTSLLLSVISILTAQLWRRFKHKESRS